MQQDPEDYTSAFIRDGFVSPVRIISEADVGDHRRIMEDAERKIGALHYQAKVHTILRSPFELATHPRVLGLVASLIGPDILVYNVEYIVKEPKSASYVSWHQDLTYWGFDNDDQVSMWLALSSASAESGCMRMIPGSHAAGRVGHEKTVDENNVLFQGQTVKQVNEDDAILCALNPGEASFHHGWTLHASTPNKSNDRRIGLNVQYLKPSMKQLKHDGDSAVLVRGVDLHHHFLEDQPAKIDLDPAALRNFRVLNRLHREIAADDSIPDQTGCAGA